MKLLPDIVQDHAEIRALRRSLHSHPELGYHEHWTSDAVAEQLSSWGIEVHRGLGGTGVVGTLRNGTSEHRIGLRADMDALPIEEANQFAHRSLHHGVMHACGHDGHTAMLLGAAKYLAQTRLFDGVVHFIFQPAEEGDGAGARSMIADGLFDLFPCDAVYGLHNWPGLPAGNFAVRSGPMMASNNDFRIDITGKGAHAALPHTGKDALLAAAQLVVALQSIVTRNKRPIDEAVLSVTQFHGGSAPNVIPESVWVGGTVRTFSLEVLDLIEERMRQMSKGLAEAFGCEAQVKFMRNYPPTVNAERETRFAVETMREIVGDDAVDDDVEMTMGAEDFSFMLQAKPGCYAFIGNGDGTAREIGHGAGACLLHNASYDFNDDIIPLGSTYWARLVERALPFAPQAPRTL